MRNNQRGFSLLELLIVVAIILIIATIAIPSFLRARQSANETKAVTNLRKLNTAEVQYSSALSVGYGDIPNLITAGLIDGAFAYSGGYDFIVTLSGDTLDFTASATARGPNDGRYDYYSPADYVIRYSTNSLRAPTGLTGEPVR